MMAYEEDLMPERRFKALVDFSRMLHEYGSWCEAAGGQAEAGRETSRLHSHEKADKVFARIVEAYEAALISGETEEE